MTHLTDFTVSLSALQFLTENRAEVRADAWNTTQVGTLLQAVIEHCARSRLSDEPLSVVSITFDASADADANHAIEFVAQIDRRTRTLIFASGQASQAQTHLLKATVVFRIG